MKNYIQIEDNHTVDLFSKRGIMLVRGESAYVWDSEGKKYIDCVAGHGVAIVGHCNPAVVKALEDQSRKLITCPYSFYNDARARLMEKLIEITPEHLTRIFLCNSGAESIEAAIKFARLSTGRKEFICSMRGFHGRTMGALSATYNPKYRQDFEPLIEGFHHVPYNKFEKIEEIAGKNTAAIILEMVQGEGGVFPGDSEFFEQVQNLCTKKKILLIVDEVQTGFCRTGKMFAFEHFGLKPDILCLAKGMGGGLPVGAVLCTEDIKLGNGKHGTTFGGNPLVSAVALASINFMLEENLARQAEEKGKYFKENFKIDGLNKVREVRQLGLMIGIELKEKVQPYLAQLLEEGVLALPAGNTVLRLLPPLTIKYEDIDFVIKKLTKVLA
ncbi:MAG: acetylornithine/succinylornithine family transaminase [Calditrichaceae bacterium]|nr:acetylornithine/succinylornithine family transaminase [Calditrichaceae bacterium]MBN2709546.1 acetylornithine/succinylornithine family transaminase [Calditrichaceae bacterium]RQV96807.1 MAG: acetylornithine/succinylornithine family transaminase [Calditrichota bacterium]